MHAETRPLAPLDDLLAVCAGRRRTRGAAWAA